MPATRNRRSPRLKDYDYGQEGAYFITVCTHERAHLFGAVVNEVMMLNDCGEIVLACWEDIPRHFSNVGCDLFVVMPNHVHGILVVVGAVGAKPKETTVGTRYIVSLRQNSPREFGKPQPGSLSTIIGTFKAAVTRKINRLRDTPGAPVWQGRFHDHIIRDEDDLNHHRQYILTNPTRWEVDRENIPLDETP